MPKFDLILIGGRTDEPYWWEDCGKFYRNIAGGRCDKSRSTKVIESIEADDFRDLDYTKTGYVRPESKSGWLSPEGKFHGCRYMEHDSYAELVLKQSTNALERSGWMKVPGQYATLYPYRHATEAQHDWARNNEHLIDGEDSIRPEPVPDVIVEPTAHN